MPYPGTATIAPQMPPRYRTWNERLNWALRDRGVTKAELARACDIERASVTEWTNGKTKDPKLRPFFLACDLLKVRPRWLALGEGMPDLAPSDSPKHHHESVVDTITRLAEHLSVAEQRNVLNILQESR